MAQCVCERTDLVAYTVPAFGAPLAEPLRSWSMERESTIRPNGVTVAVTAQAPYQTRTTR